MDALARFEDKLEEALETSFSRLMKSPLQPVEIAARLSRAMESERTVGVGETLAPNRYEVRLSPADYAGVEPFRVALEKRLAEFLAAHARQRGFSLVGPPVVSVLPDERVAEKRPRITTGLADAVSQGAGEQSGALAAGHTTKLPVRRASPNAAATLTTLSDGRAYHLTAAVTAIGRHLDSDIVLDDTRVSRHHAQVWRQADVYQLRDLGSANGTSVNGVRTDECRLREGDVISLGGVELLFKGAGSMR